MHQHEADELLEELTRTSNRLRGRLCGLVESWDLGAKRERAMIDCIKNTSYDGERELKRLLHGLSRDDELVSR